LNWNILVPGDYLISCKGVSDALYAVARLRETLPRVRLVRVSLYPLSDEEREITKVDADYSMLPPKDMVDLYRQADVLISTALPPEGFGLPAAEAMASGVPVILTRIPSYLGFDERRDYAVFVDMHSPEAVAGGALRLIRNRRQYLRLRNRGIEVVQQNFSADRVALNIERAIAQVRHAA
jgi:glycosyltransferase involved in cell wall biosynthesis